jgi:hypothetical protein
VVCNGIRGRVFAYARVHVHRRLVGAIAIAAASRARPGRIIGKHLAIGERTPFLIHSPPSRSRFILRTRIARKSRKCARARARYRDKFRNDASHVRRVYASIATREKIRVLGKFRELRERNAPGNGRWILRRTESP